VLLFRYLFKETLKTQLAVLFVLMLIFLSQRFVKILANASEGDIPADLVLTLVGLNLPYLALLMLPLSLFVGILFAFGRLYAESEMTVMYATGYSPVRVMRTAQIMALLTAAVAGLNTFWLAPYAMERQTQVLEQAEADAGLATLMQGRFQKPGGQAVVYVEQISPRRDRLERVFVARLPSDELSGDKKERPSIIVAEGGVVHEDGDGVQWLTLEQGHRYEGLSDRLDYRLLDFDSYRIRLKDRQVERKRRKLNAEPTLALLGSDDPDYIAELQWRISLPLSIPLLTLIVVPLSAVNPRQGRYAKLFPAILLYLSYFMLLSASRSAIESGSLSPWIGMWGVHGLALLLGVILNLKGSRWGNQLAEWITRRRG